MDRCILKEHRARMRWTSGTSRKFAILFLLC